MLYDSAEDRWYRTTQEYFIYSNSPTFSNISRTNILKHFVDCKEKIRHASQAAKEKTGTGVRIAAWRGIIGWVQGLGLHKRQDLNASKCHQRLFRH